MYAYNPIYKTKFAICVENNFMTFKIEVNKFFILVISMNQFRDGMGRNAF